MLSYLARGNNILFVSTHESQLTGLLGEQYDTYHFSGFLDAGQVKFDYKIRPGKLEATNAIKLLEDLGFPDEVTREAKQIVQDFWLARPQ